MTTPNACHTNPELADIVDYVVTACAPRVFALVQIDQQQTDGRILAWGMAFDDRVEVVGSDGHMSGRFASVDSVHRRLCRHESLRLVWPAGEPPATGAAPDGIWPPGPAPAGSVG